ncbi:hypothetical protein LJB86_03575 [Deltaproteobacteria bacterium OttesenSCG-928-M10]|nr:hypothetical protein [Deltaproteobacteria bacterium OttesenSCG-928-M10]
MLREFAVEPALLGEYGEFRYLSEKFGVQKARMIAEFPKKWRSMVYKSAVDFTPMQKKSLEAWLKNKKTFLVPSGRDCETLDDWLHSAELAHDRHPFHAILATTNPRGHEKVILTREIPLENEILFNCPHEVFMPREPEAFADISCLLLRHSRQIIFVDPHAHASNTRRGDRWGEALSAMFGCIHPEATIRYCAMDFSRGEEIDCRLNNLKENWPQFIPKGKILEFVLLDKDDGMDTHNRFILTERGGIKFAWGLDASKNSGKDVVNVMAEKTHASLLDEYDNLAGRSVLGRVDIIGLKVI